MQLKSFICSTIVSRAIDSLFHKFEIHFDRTNRDNQSVWADVHSFRIDLVQVRRLSLGMASLVFISTRPWLRILGNACPSQIQFHALLKGAILNQFQWIDHTEEWFLIALNQVKRLKIRKFSKSSLSWISERVNIYVVMKCLMLPHHYRS